MARQHRDQVSTATRFTALDKIDDMAAVLASAALIHTPGFAAPEAGRRFIEDRRADFEANAKNLLYVALTRARDRLVLEWPGFIKERDEDAPEAKCLFHVFNDASAPQVGSGKLRIGGVDCPSHITQMPEHAGFTEYLAGTNTDTPRLGHATPLPAVTLTPWRLQPSQFTTAQPAPDSRSVTLGMAWTRTVSDAARGTALHFALRTCLTRPDLITALPMATGLDEETLEQVAERAGALKAWLAANGYTDLQCEIPVLGHSPDGAEIPGMIDLLATGPQGCLLIDHKTGGAGAGLGPYWPQLLAYAGLLARVSPKKPVLGAAIHWVDHGKLEIVSTVGINV
jgi:ATP-dependent helicase/nuclease subunit A